MVATLCCTTLGAFTHFARTQELDLDATSQWIEKRVRAFITCLDASSYHTSFRPITLSPRAPPTYVESLKTIL